MTVQSVPRNVSSKPDEKTSGYRGGRRQYGFSTSARFGCVQDLTTCAFFFAQSIRLERDSLARKSSRHGEKPDAVDVFRGVSFDDWLQLFMQVSCKLNRVFVRSLILLPVLFQSDAKRTI